MTAIMLVLVLFFASLPGAQAEPAIDCDLSTQDKRHNWSEPLNLLLADRNRSILDQKAYVWANTVTGALLIAMQVAPCGNQWLLAIWRQNRFATHLWPNQNVDEAWKYITQQVRDASAIRIGWHNVQFIGDRLTPPQDWWRGINLRVSALFIPIIWDFLYPMPTPGPAYYEENYERPYPEKTRSPD